VDKTGLVEVLAFNDLSDMPGGAITVGAITADSLDAGSGAITTTGSIGIGADASTPARPLDVDGVIRWRTPDNISYAEYLWISGDTPDSIMIAARKLSGSDYPDFAIEVGGDNNIFRIDASTLRVGINVTTPAAKLDILETTEQLRLKYDASNYASFTIDSGGDLLLTASGGDISFGDENITTTGTVTADQLIAKNGTDTITIDSTDGALKSIRTDSGALYIRPAGTLVGWFDATQFGFYGNKDFQFGASGTSHSAIRYSEHQTVDALMISLSDFAANNQGRYMIICDHSDQTFDFEHANQSTPTVFFHSDAQSTTEWGSITHDGTDFLFNAGAGVANFSALGITTTGTVTLAGLTATANLDIGGYLFRSATMHADSTVAGAGILGVGIAPQANSAAYVNYNPTSTTANSTVLYFAGNYAPSGNTAKHLRAIAGSIVYNSSNDSTGYMTALKAGGWKRGSGDLAAIHTLYLGDAGIYDGTGSVTNVNYIKIDDGRMDGTGGAAITNFAGIWMADLTKGSNNYGIVISSDTIGLTLGAGQDVTIKWDGSATDFGSSPINTTGAVTITNSYVCAGGTTYCACIGDTGSCAACFCDSARCAYFADGSKAGYLCDSTYSVCILDGTYGIYIDCCICGTCGIFGADVNNCGVLGCNGYYGVCGEKGASGNAAGFFCDGSSTCVCLIDGSNALYSSDGSYYACLITGSNAGCFCDSSSNCAILGDGTYAACFYDAGNSCCVYIGGGSYGVCSCCIIRTDSCFDCGGNNGVSATFTNGDGETVTVSGGIITNIAPP